MITITIDCNSDEVRMVNENTREKVVLKTSARMKQIQDIIYEMLNMIAPGGIGTENVRLIQIDEDQRETIGEW